MCGQHVCFELPQRFAEAGRMSTATLDRLQQLLLLLLLLLVVLLLVVSKTCITRTTIQRRRFA